jgi:hypothetical protein
MPGAAIVAAALNTAASRSKGLFVGSVDVIADPVAPVDYAVPIESVTIDHKGPCGVSSMTFTVECYGVPAAVSIADGMDVRFYDFTNTRTLFAGFVDHVDIENLPGDRGTVYRVECVGYEAILDWSVLAADLTIPQGTAVDTAVQIVFASCTGTSLGRINATANPSGPSTDANPIGVSGVLPFPFVPLTIPAGTTMREAIRQCAAQIAFADPTESLVSTVDFNGGLRFFVTAAVDLGGVSNWNFSAINNDSPSSSNGEVTSYGIDAAQYRGVLVKGTGVTVFVPNGSGKEGAIAVLTDTTITTIAQATVAGNAYLASYATQARGSYQLTDKAPATSSIPGGKVTITDQRLGLSATVFSVGSLRRTFNNSQRENWTVAFGGQPPSVAALARQLTRTTLS